MPRLEHAWLYSIDQIRDWRGWTPLEVGVHAKRTKRWYVELVRRAGRMLIDYVPWDGRGDWYLSALPDPCCRRSAFILAVQEREKSRVHVLSQAQLPYLLEEPDVREIELAFDWSPNVPAVKV